MNKSRIFLLLLGLLLLFAQGGHAAPCPWDAKGSATDDCSIVQTDHFELTYATRTKGAVQPLVKVIDSHLRGFGKRMGAPELVTATPRIQVYIAPNAKAFARAQPSRNAPIEWAAGVAYSAQDLIILSLDSKHFFQLHDIARHEISHIALYRATDTHMPRWFNEGLAILHAEEYLLQRIQLADHAFLAGAIKPFSELTHFPRNPGAIPLAYAQSARFVRYLEREHHLRSRLPLLLKQIREGSSFETAFTNTMGMPLSETEVGWHAEMEENTSWFTLLVDSQWLWVLAAFIFLLAYVVKRIRLRKTLAQWQLEEGREEEEIWPPHPLPPSASPPAGTPSSSSSPAADE